MLYSTMYFPRYGGYLADSQNEVDIKYVGELAMAAGLTSYWSGEWT